MHEENLFSVLFGSPDFVLSPPVVGSSMVGSSPTSHISARFGSSLNQGSTRSQLTKSARSRVHRSSVRLMSRPTSSKTPSWMLYAKAPERSAIDPATTNCFDPGREFVAHT